MVKFRGINVSMVSQHGIRKIPEYELPVPADGFGARGLELRTEEKASIASCIVPSYPGSQIWFDYSIENPHPPNAQYFFKLTHNGEVLTSWDCTAKHGYAGRTTYALKCLGVHPQTGQPVVERQGFRFSTEESSHSGPSHDFIEVKVYRIEHRERLPLGEASVKADEILAGANICHDGFRLVNGGTLASNEPKRYYKYQLLDPVDKPHATIRFYYRSHEFLLMNGLVGSSNHSRQTSTASNSSRTSSNSSNTVSRSTSEASSTRSPTRSLDSTRTGSSRPGSPPTDSVAAWLRHHRLHKYTAILGSMSFDSLVELSDDDLARLGVAAKGSRAKLLRECATYKCDHPKPVEGIGHETANMEVIAPVNPAPTIRVFSPSSSTGSSQALKSEKSDSCFDNPATDSSVRIITKDSMEATALRAPSITTLSAPAQKKDIFIVTNSALNDSPQSASSAIAEKVNSTTEDMKPLSPRKSPKKFRKSLKVQIHGAEFELERESKRPLSPFTSSGILRRLLSPGPSSAPAQMTAFGPSIDDEVGEMLAEMESGRKGGICLQRTTRAERGGAMMKKILGRRIGRA